MFSWSRAQLREHGVGVGQYGFADPRELGHWRIYGDDFADRLAAEGLAVQPLMHGLSPQDCKRYGITPERFYVCRKTSELGVPAVV